MAHLNNDLLISKVLLPDGNTYENYYNVKNIVNKDNKLYISNYLTTNDENIDVSNINFD